MSRLKAGAFAALAVLAISPTPTTADPAQWMKSGKPNELGLFVNSSERCPISTDQLREIVEGEFLRARIKPTENLSLNLTVNLQCLSIETEGDTALGFAVKLDVQFGSYSIDHGIDNFLYDSPSFGGMFIDGIDSDRYTRDGIRKNVGNALTAFLEANR